MMGPSRANGLANMLDTIKRRTRALVKDLPFFPSLRITASELRPQGTFAEVQAQYLRPDQLQVRAQRPRRAGGQAARRGGHGGRAGRQRGAARPLAASASPRPAQHRPGLCPGPAGNGVAALSSHV
jgi:hypothetical protein